MGITMNPRAGRLSVLVLTLAFLAGLMPVAGPAAMAATTSSSEFTVTASDLEFILAQIRIAETHATKEGPAGSALGTVTRATRLLGVGPNDIADPTLPWGLRQVDGRNNNLMPGRSEAGAADTLFPRVTAPEWRSGVNRATPSFSSGEATTYAPANVSIFDTQPRVISNLIVDQTSRNPAAVAASGSATPPDVTSGGYGPASIEILNTPSLGGVPVITSPYNSLFTFFGQFFDHGLDLVGKKPTTVVALPLPADDDLTTGTMFLSRTDFPATSNVQVTSGLNKTTPWVDQNQTYASVASKQVFIRDYALSVTTGTSCVTLSVATGCLYRSTGRLLTGSGGSIGTWKQVKEQAFSKLGIALTDADVLNVPLILTDEYGRFLRGPNGNPVLALTDGTFREGNLNSPVSTAGAYRTNHAFLDDIAHNAAPKGTFGNALTADSDGTVGSPTARMLNGQYDDELLGTHFITGDGRGNENIGLTALHSVFHAEHNRLREDIDAILTGLGSGSPIYQGFHSATGWGYGERLFQAARLVNEMEYQHLVFDTFVRRIEPGIHAFAGYDPSVDPSVSAEFANAVYRFGHSMLNETVARKNASGGDDSLLLFDAFLNPPAFLAGYPDAMAAAGAIARGSVMQTGNEIDEFVTGALRNNLVGMPIDLATLNIARGRDTGTASLNNVRMHLFNQLQASTLVPYMSWLDFGFKLRTRASLVNFVAAYGTHPSLTDGTMTTAARRTVAYKLVNGTNPDGSALSVEDQALFADRDEFLTATGRWARPLDDLGMPLMANGLIDEGTTGTGVDDIDLWIGGLAEKRGTFGGLLGSTFTWIFKTQLERLQDGDRLYYLARLAGTNLLAQVANNTLADMFVRNTDVTGLPFDLFSAPAAQRSVNANPYVYGGTDNIVLDGTAANDRIRSGDGNDTIRGYAGNDVIDGDDGSDSIQGGTGNDVLTDSGLIGLDIMRGGSGNDYISSGSGLDVVDGDDGNDFLRADADGPTLNGGPGADLLLGGVGADLLDGGDQADWVEGGSLGDTILGDAGAPPLGNTFSGNGPDVLIGGDGPDLYIAGGADDVIGGGDAASRATWSDSIGGDTGFDWVTYMTGTYSATKPGVTADLLFAAPVPGNPVQATMDTFVGGDVEGVSGGPGRDVILGDDRLTNLNPFGQGDELSAGSWALAPGSALIPRMSRNALDQTVVNGVTTWKLANGVDGNILLGGAGSDTITGRLGNDLIDGDAFLRVRLQTTCGTGGTWQDITLANLRSRVAAGTLDASCTAAADKVRIVREILAGTPGTDVDVAAYQFARAMYHIRSASSASGTYYVVEGPEGTDVLWNIEVLQFLDGTVAIANSLTNGVVLPSRPDAVIAVPGNGTATIKWSLPLQPGGGLITQYEAVARDALGTIVNGCTAAGLTPATRTCTIIRLVSGADYTIEVTATNNDGTSNLSQPVTVRVASANAGLPGAPTMSSARAVDGQATIRWNGGNSNGSAITNYTARVWTSNPRSGIPVFTCMAPSSPCIVAGPLSPYGLAPYGKYWVDVVATNGVGDSAPSALMEMTTVPTEPENVRLTALGATTATVAWDVPAGTGGGTLTVTGYAARIADPAGVEAARTCTVTSPTTSCSFTGLTTGKTYEATITATNGVGTGPASTPLSVMPTPSAPSAPAAPTPTPGDAQVSLTWNPAASNGGSTILDYRAVLSTVANPDVSTGSCTVAASASAMTCTIVNGTGGAALTNGTQYRAVIYARNAIGTSAPSAAATFIPATAPTAPTSVSPLAGNQTVTVSWGLPSSNGGSDVTGYQARVFTTGGTQVGTTCSTSTLSCTFNAGSNGATLVNGTTYEVDVRATNPVGWGPWSSRVQFTPQAVAPSAPSTPTASRSVSGATAGSVTINWTALTTTAQTGGAPIMWYRVRAYDATTGGSVILDRTTGNAATLSMTFTSGDFAVKGQALSYSVAGVNYVGSGSESPRVTIASDILPGTPDQPVLSAVTSTNLTASWVAPTNLGSPITSYLVRAWTRATSGSIAGSCTWSTGALSCTITTLRRTTQYWVDVVATNGAGTGSVSSRATTTTTALR